MKTFPTANIRNVALVGHGGAGKTSLAEALLFTAGATTRLGKIEDGTTVADFDPEEQRRRISVSLALAPFKLDRERASFQRTLDQLKERFGAGVAPLHLPIGEEASFRGVVELLNDKAIS